MPMFSYTAVDDAGRSRRGRREAPNESTLESLLKDEGQWLSQARLMRSGRKLKMRKHVTSVPRRALVEFFLQLNIQLKAGIPVLSALSFGATECPHLGFRAIQRELLEQVEAGESLSDAMAAHSRVFPPLVINLMRAGEASGRLPETCQELHRHFEWLDVMIADVRQALVYPLFVLASTIGFMLVLFTFLIPRFAVMLAELKVPLPALTRFMLGTSAFAVAHWSWIVGLPIAALIVAKIARRRSAAVAEIFDRAKLRLPVFGHLNRLICLSRFAHNLAVLYRAGVSILESLALSRGLVGNQVVAQAVQEIEIGVNEGMPMHEVMAKQPVFSKLILQMVQVGESTGNLGEALQNVADYYNDVIPRLIKKVFTIMEPAMILFLIGLVAVVALAIFLPIANLLEMR